MTDLYSHRIADIVLTPKEPGLDSGNINAQITNGEIELRQVSFSYSTFDQSVFRGISLRFTPGEFVAIVGPSGCGKSTLLKVLCGLYPPTAGDIFVDGQSLVSVGATNFRQALGVVMQDDDLLTGTIAENVAFFDENIDIDRVWLCLKTASIVDEITAMPMRAETFVGDMGSSLSGGQKQRLLLARALYRRPRILVLDEATSHLDTEREHSINLSLRGLKITRIVVAHRQETIDAADRVIRLENGVIVSDKSVCSKIAHIEQPLEHSAL